MQRDVRLETTIHMKQETALVGVSGRERARKVQGKGGKRMDAYRSERAGLYVCNRMVELGIR